jgi:hypothetical protein
LFEKPFKIQGERKKFQKADKFLNKLLTFETQKGKNSPSQRSKKRETPKIQLTKYKAMQDQTPEAPDKTASSIEKNKLTIQVLEGTQIAPEDFAKVAVRFTRSAGPKLLNADSYETALEIAANEKVAPELRDSTKEVMAAHEAALGKVLENVKPALITILTHPVGAEKTEALTDAYKELGGLGSRLLSHRILPGLSRDPEKHSTILNGISRDAYNAIKDKPDFADLVSAAETRKGVAKERVTELRASFEDKFTDAQVRLFRTLETIQAYQTDPGLVKFEDKKALVVNVGEGKDAKQVPIFEKGKLTKEAKAKLNELQAEEGQPEFLVKMIRGAFAKDSQNKDIAAAKKDIGL